MAAAAIEQPDFGLAYLDRTRGVYRPCGVEDLDYLKALVAMLDSPEAVADLDFYWRHRASIIKNFEAETGRNLAALLIGNKKRRGVGYSLVKLGVRTVVNGAKLYYRMTGRLLFVGKESAKLENGSALLVSHIVDRRDVCARAIAQQQLKTRYLVHDIIPLVQPASHPSRMITSFDRWLRRAAAEKAKLICVSNGTARDLEQWFRDKVGIDYSRQIHACPLTGVGLPVAGDTQPVKAIGDDRFVLYVSTFNPRKNHDFLVEVWDQLIAERGAESTPLLVLIGRDKPYKTFQAALAAHPTAAAKIINLGSVSNETLRWAYKTCLFAVFPSQAEGWGLGVTEALRFGKPVIHTDTPQLNEASQGLMPALANRDHKSWTARTGAWIGDRAAIKPYRDAAERFEEAQDGGFANRVLSVLRTP
ncbi:MAG: glycosyltransferase [Pseudomonadota bacterium]